METPESSALHAKERPQMSALHALIVVAAMIGMAISAVKVETFMEVSIMMIVPIGSMEIHILL